MTGQSRRSFLTGLAASSLAAPAIAQPARLSYTLSWLPTGGNAFVYMARQLGYWKRRGIEVDISAGHGSLASIQAVSQGRFDAGNAGAGVALLNILKGLDLAYVNTVSYDSGMGIIVPENRAITSPAQLAGHSVGATASGADTPFLPAYFQRLGLAPGAVTITYLDPQIIESATIAGRVDAMVAIATSSVPKFVTGNVPFRFFPLADQGVKIYGGATLVSGARLKQNRSLFAEFAEGLEEGLKFALLNPHETIDRFLREHAEIAIGPTGRQFAELGLGIANVQAIAAEAEEFSLGYTDLAALNAQAHLVRDYIGSEGDPQPRPAATYATNELIGNVTLTASEWQQARQYAAPYAAFVGRKL